MSVCSYTCCSCVCRPKIKDDGTVDIKARGLSLIQSLSVKNDGRGRIELRSTACTFDVNKISVDFHGGARLVTGSSKHWIRSIYIIAFHN